ncbi:unnamed protein product, partial [Didymodactylos carnosus]
ASDAGSGVTHTAASDNVRVRSSITSDTQSQIDIRNTDKLNELMQKLSTTHTQLDAYSKQRTDKINEDLAASVQEMIAETQAEQYRLVEYANARTKAVEENYKVKIEKYFEEINVQKAQSLAILEKQLNDHQQAILDRAKQQIDLLNSEANDAKLNVMKEAQAKVNAEIVGITNQVQQLVAEETTHNLQSATTMVITSESSSASVQHTGVVDMSATGAATTFTY